MLVCELAVERLGTQDDRVLGANDHVIVEMVMWEIEVAADSLLDLAVAGITPQLYLGESELFATTIETDVQGTIEHLCHLYIPPLFKKCDVDVSTMYLLFVKWI